MKLIPNHLAIICDGNRRFAENLGKEKWKGHEYGADKVEEVLDWCFELGIKTLTLWLFSTENFNRPKEEVKTIFELAKKFGKKFLENEKVHKNKVKFNFIGNMNLFPEDVQAVIKEVTEATKDYDGFYLNIAAGYGGKQEILEATKNIARFVKEGKIKPEDINNEILESNMYSGLMPNVDLIIRTSGEQRTSGFLLWKSDYAEYYFCEKFWPEFEKEDLIKAIYAYSERKRRYGK